VRSGSIAAEHEQARGDALRAPITLITHEFFPARGGAGVYAQELACAAARLGYEVRVLAPEHPRWKELDLPVELEALGHASPLKDWWYFPATAFHFLANRRRFRTQVLHIGQQGPLRIMLLLRLLGLVRPHRLIVTLHGSELLQLAASRAGGRWLLGKLLDRADRVTVLSQWVRGKLLHHYPRVASKTVLAPGAPRALRSPRRRQAANPGSQLTLLTVGRIHPRKGQHAVLEALHLLDENLRGRIRYLVVGPVVDDRYSGSLRRLATSAGAEVIFTGEVTDEALVGHYEGADIFIMTSEQQPRSVEGFGLAYLEASANGLPVIGYRCGGVEDAVRHDVTGLLIEPGDVAGLATALKRLIQDPELRERLGAQGRDWAARFSWEASAEAVYGNLAGSGRRRPG
jgi:phosphatidylinositol alpha-1,6-mannosyltransferase